ncbi:MAG: RHS repeat-associated core domain-containing protein, partial [Bacteroidales bacterium]|nr:RHS repeat-associated core domain-containing protein [Bacteroidales bacterium]
RMYDPTVGRFLSPDPYVQDGTNPQNFNRYSYCLNNPLKYTDPSGYEYRDTPRRDEDMAMIEDDEYWSLAEHVRDYIFSGSSGGGMSFNWGNSSRKREKLDVKTLLSTYLLENFWNDLSRILSEISQQEGFDWSKVAIGVETIVGQSTASGVKVEATGILGSVMFLGGDDAGYVYQYYGGEVGAGVETSVGASVSVGKSYFVAYNYTANNAHYEFDGDYSYINVSAGWSIPGFELGFVGSLSYAKGKHWLVISESVEATAGVGVSTGFTGGITAGGGHITFINKENVGKPKSLYQIFFR